MRDIEKKQVVILLSVAAMAAMLSSVAFTAYANNTNGLSSSNGSGITAPEMTGLGRGGPCGRGRGGFVEVSAEYNQTVTDIAKNDEDVQNLLNEGYSISSIRPVIKTIVQGDGSVVTKATTAILVLEKDTTGRAAVYVDIQNAKVTQIVILTRTVLDKTT